MARKPKIRSSHTLSRPPSPSTSTRTERQKRRRPSDTHGDDGSHDSEYSEYSDIEYEADDDPDLEIFGQAQLLPKISDQTPAPGKKRKHRVLHEHRPRLDIEPGLAGLTHLNLGDEHNLPTGRSPAEDEKCETYFKEIMYHAILCRLKDAENPQDRVESAGVPHRSRRHIIAPSLRTALCTAYHNSPGKLWTLIEQGFPQEVRRVLGGMIFGICRFTDMLTKE
jgi:hypothetical protein